MEWFWTWKGEWGRVGHRESLVNPAFVRRQGRRTKKGEKKTPEEAVQEIQNQIIPGEFLQSSIFSRLSLWCPCGLCIVMSKEMSSRVVYLYFLFSGPERERVRCKILAMFSFTSSVHPEKCTWKKCFLTEANQLQVCSVWLVTAASICSSFEVKMPSSREMQPTC